MPRLLTKIVNMTQITINGKSFKLEYNLATAINFQRLTGINAFEISKLEGDLQLLSALGYGMLLANNPIEEVPTLDEMLASLNNVNLVTEFFNAISKEMLAFYKQPNGDPKPDNEEEKSTNAYRLSPYTSLSWERAESTRNTSYTG